MNRSTAGYKIERGETEVKVNHVYMIAAVLGVSIYDLLPPSLENSVGGDYLLKPIVDYLNKLVIMAYVRYKKKRLGAVNNI